MGGEAANSGLCEDFAARSVAPELVHEGSCFGSGLAAPGGSAGLKLRQRPPPARCPAAVRCPWTQTDLRSCSGIGGTKGLFILLAHRSL